MKDLVNKIARLALVSLLLVETTGRGNPGINSDYLASNSIIHKLFQYNWLNRIKNSSTM